MLLPNTKLKNQLALVNTVSKAVIIILAIFVIPGLVRTISIRETDNQLIKKLDQVYDLIELNGIHNFIENEDNNQSFGSYTILKEEYISIEKTKDSLLYEYIEDQKRKIEDEIHEYRVISATFSIEDQFYLIEIGKSINTVISFEKKLKSFAFYILLFLLSISIFIDLSITQILLKPFEKIIERLKKTQHPKQFDYTLVQTKTSDFNILQESISQLMHQIENAFETEREYIGNVSHEILTPISILQTKLDNFTEKANLNEIEMRKVLEIKATLRQLTKIIRSLLLLSRIENREFLKNESVNLAKLFENVKNEIEDRASIKHQTLVLSNTANNAIIKGNNELIRILLSNLLLNAIKYTPENGKINLSISTKSDLLFIDIADNGYGISEDELPFIFDRFRKFGTQKESFGLGLAIVKQIADYHKIKIKVESKIKSGTHFQLVFDNINS